MFSTRDPSTIAVVDFVGTVVASWLMDVIHTREVEKKHTRNTRAGTVVGREVHKMF